MRLINVSCMTYSIKARQTLYTLMHGLIKPNKKINIVMIQYFSWLPCVTLIAHSCFSSGACPGFLKGGDPISLGSLKKGHQILKGGVQWSDGGGGVQYISLTRTTNLAYLDAKE